MKKITVYLFDINNVTSEELKGSLFLLEKDLEELSRFKVEEVYKEKLASRILKRKYVGDFYLGEKGKPLSDKVYFNSSDSKGLVALAVSPVPVGIDIERVRDYKDNMRDYISSYEEKEYIRNEYNFYEVWTSKEGLVKCVGTGINKRVNEIPAFPLNGKKSYENKVFFSKTFRRNDYIFSVTIESTEDFEIEFKEEK